MKAPDGDGIRSFILQRVEQWNAGDKNAFTELYRSFAPNGLRIEYVGEPVREGWATLEDMWDTYNSLVEVELGEVLVNGNEGACYIRNILVEDGMVTPSIEIYRFENGVLHVRCFHRPRSFYTATK